jgi:hypothetical protein
MSLAILGYIAAFIATYVGGIATHGWMTRQKSPTLTLDAIKAATAILNAARAASAAEVLAATQRDEAIALALKHASETLVTPTVQ